MKRLLVALIVLLSISGLTSGEIIDYVRWDHPSKYIACSPGDLPFLVTYQCPVPPGGMLCGLSLGFAITMTGSATISYTPGEGIGFTIFHQTDWFNLGFLVDDSKMPDTLLVGGAGFMGVCMPQVIDEPLWTMHVSFGAGEGEICIDSAFIPSAGSWTFSGTTCDPVGGPRPYFVDAAGSDANHPICVPVEMIIGNPPTITVEPSNDTLSGEHCSVLSFDFDAYAGDLDGVPALPLTWAVVSGPGSFSDNTYSVGPMDAGDYPVEIAVTNACCLDDYYSFTVESTNQAPSITNSGSQPSKAYAGYTYWWQFDAVDSDTCDALTWSVTISDSPTNMPTIDDTGLLQWETELGESGVFEICVIVDDSQPETGADTFCFDVDVLAVAPICGDANGSGAVDIDDVVYILSYIFSGGPPPVLLEVGNPDCLSGTDIDDVVYMIAYVFAGGTPPCDPSNDGVPDC